MISENKWNNTIPCSEMNIHPCVKNIKQTIKRGNSEIQRSLSHSFLRSIYLSNIKSPNLPLNNLVHFSMISSLHNAKASQHILFFHSKQNNSKVSVEMISEEQMCSLTKIIFIHSVSWDIGHIHLGEKFTHSLLFLFPNITPTFCSYH